MGSLPVADRFLLSLSLRIATGGEADPTRDARHAVYRAVLDQRLDAAWVSSTTWAVAKGIFADRTLEEVPILADALQDAGCDNADLLAACRSGSPLERGWGLYRVVFDFAIRPDGWVDFTLPAGMTYCEAILGIHSIRGEVPYLRDGTPPQARPAALRSELVPLLRRDKTATRKNKSPLSHSVIGVVPGSTAIKGQLHNGQGVLMNRAGQEEHLRNLVPPLAMPRIEAAILAYCLLYGATGEDLFEGNFVRVRDTLVGMRQPGPATSTSRHAVLFPAEDGLKAHIDLDTIYSNQGCCGSPV